MKQFMDENFLLDTKTAQDLFHNHAAKMPIIDYHCHLIPEMVANDHKFKSITELWLGGDHYKWRAMRTNGVDERFCTGTDTSDWEKFEKWAETVPYTFRNPLYHWTHLELKTAFGINKQLSPKTARWTVRILRFWWDFIIRRELFTKEKLLLPRKFLRRRHFLIPAWI